MNTLRLNRTIIALCLVAIFLICVVSCGKDNDNDNNQKQDSKLTLLQQKWNLVKQFDTAVSPNNPPVYKEYTGKAGDYYYFKPEKTLDIVFDSASSFKTSDPYQFTEITMSYTFYGDTFHILELTTSKLEIYKKVPAYSTGYMSQHVYLAR
jgi:hypothetical protein